MASRRQLKKRISYVCGGLADDLQLAASLFDGISIEKERDILVKIASLQEETRANATFSFDKVCKDFENRAQYNRARSKYYAEAFAHLRSKFTEQAMAIVKEMNEVIPANIREAVSGK